MAIAHSIARIT